MSFLKRIIELTTFDLHKELPLDVLIKLLFTNLFSFIIMISATIFVFVSLNNGAVYLAYLLLGLISIHIFNFIIFFWKKNIILTKYIVVLSVEVLFIILLINGGKVGYGYLWFYGFPIISMFIIGRKSGRLINLSFLLIIVSLLFIPKDLISHEYNNSLIFRIIISYFIISAIINLILFIHEKVIQDLNKKIQNKNKLFEEKNKLFFQLSNESKNTFNDIINISNKINTKCKNIQENNIELLHNSTINLVNIINNITELSEYKIDSSELQPLEFNLLKTIDNTIQIFSTKLFIIKLNYSEKIPNTIIGNPIKIKQVLYDILNSISKNINEKCKINIIVEAKSKNDNNINLRFKIEVNKDIINNNKSFIKSNNILLSSVNENIELLNLSYTNNLIVKSGGYLFIENDISNTKFKFSCSFNINNTKNNRLSDIFLSNIDKKKIFLTEELLRRMNILFVDNNILNKKLGEIELKTKFNKIEFVDNYKDALNNFTKNKFEIIIVNSKINNINCNTFVRKIKEYEYGINSNIKIIVINTDDDNLNKSELLSYGVIGFCDRNININKLIKIIRENN